MTERGILFSAPMVRALLAGRKTQTRRLLNPQPEGHHWESLPGYRQEVKLLDTSTGLAARCSHWLDGRQDPNVQWVGCRYGRPGDRLWGRETWAAVECEQGAQGAFWGPDHNWSIEDNNPEDQWMRLEYAADATLEPGQYGIRRLSDGRLYDGGWRPSIHMPRWASRLVLEVTDVRVERLQQITQKAARAEGVVDTSGAWRAILGEPLRDTDRCGPRGAFESLWRDIHGPESWDANPWVWAVSFRVATP